MVVRSTESKVAINLTLVEVGASAGVSHQSAQGFTQSEVSMRCSLCDIALRAKFPAVGQTLSSAASAVSVSVWYWMCPTWMTERLFSIDEVFFFIHIYLHEYFS
jgi:hypothetical protein